MAEAHPIEPVHKVRYVHHVHLIAILYAFLLYLAWTGAWLIELQLESEFTWMTTSGGRFLYWQCMKMLLWVLPALLLIRMSGLRLNQIFSLTRWRSILVYGGGVGLVLGLFTLVTKLTLGHPIFASSLSWPFFGAVFIAPLIEELTFRGAIMGALSRKYPFWAANSISAALFLGSHLPGWYFQHVLLQNMTSTVGGALSIFLLGLVFGYVARKSNSVAASTLTHTLNNLFNC